MKTRIAFVRRHWLLSLLLVMGLTALTGNGPGPTFSADDSEFTVPGWITGVAILAVAIGMLVRAWCRERRVS